MPIETLSSLDLSLTDIPSDEADIETLEKFALTFDGYEFWGSLEACAEQARFDCHCVDHLRTRLFFDQRAGRHGNGLQREEATPVLRLLRTSVSAETRPTCIHDDEVSPQPVLGIVDLLRHFGFDSERPTKLVRHQDKRFDIHELIESGWFDLYQACQKNDVFGKCDFIVTFTADGGTRSRLLGVYRVLNSRKRLPEDIPADSPFGEWVEESGYFYELMHEPQYSGLEGRVVVDWGNGALAWHQHLRNKEVIEIDATGRFLSPFSDYLDFSLSYSELCRMFAEPSAHRDWRASLSAVSGVYLILDEKEGRQYVGSAYGADGIWGRWSDYARNGHGGNKCLEELIAMSTDYPKRFRYSILQVLPKSTKPKEVIGWETRYKTKLGCRVTGLNAN